MREILFKAKREDNGEWVEGNLVYCKASVGKSELCLIVCGAEWLDNPKWFNLCNEHYVDTETVCQYTGLKDKNGKKIWENDIIKMRICNIEMIGKVVFDDCAFEFSNDDCDEFLWDRNEIEVIGNIFDNPELMEV